jgi:hypothetical protein
MRAWFFSENAYHLLPDAREYDSIRVKLPNRYYDPKIGADLYHRFIDEWLIAEELGLEIMVNEHHQTATNLNPSAAVVMGALARVTRAREVGARGYTVACLLTGFEGTKTVFDSYRQRRAELGLPAAPYHPVASTVNAMKGVTPGIYKMFQRPRSRRSWSTGSSSRATPIRSTARSCASTSTWGASASSS